MRSNDASSKEQRSPLALSLAAIAVLLFMHLPVLIILLYAFTTDEATYSFPPPGLTVNWFGVALGRADFWQALFLSLRVALIATALAILLGTLAAAAVHRSRFFGREAVSFLLILPLALPGIVTGIALRSAMSLVSVPFTFWTIVIGHATFCVVVVYNNGRKGAALHTVKRKRGSRGRETANGLNTLPSRMAPSKWRRPTGYRPRS